MAADEADTEKIALRNVVTLTFRTKPDFLKPCNNTDRHVYMFEITMVSFTAVAKTSDSQSAKQGSIPKPNDGQLTRSW